MVESTVIETIRDFLKSLNDAGLETSFAVLFGSYANDRNSEWSDIDLVVVSPVFDSLVSREPVNLLWRTAARTDSRIEPTPCGERQWEEDEGTPIIGIARAEGMRIDR